MKVNGIDLAVGQWWVLEDGRSFAITSKEIKAHAERGAWRLGCLDERRFDLDGVHPGTWLVTVRGFLYQYEGYRGVGTIVVKAPLGRPGRWYRSRHHIAHIAACAPDGGPNPPLPQPEVTEVHTATPPINPATGEPYFTIGADGWGSGWLSRAPDLLPHAPELLARAAEHMAARAATYDNNGEGERSMERTVKVFNAYHGTTLTETQGWHLLQILKDVRLFSSPTYHADSAEDCISYAALKAEARAKETITTGEAK